MQNIKLSKVHTSSLVTTLNFTLVKNISFYICLFYFFNIWEDIFLSLKVVQRLSENDENLLAQMCEKLNSAIWKGPFMETMIDDVTNFKIKERQSERRLTQYEGTYLTAVIVCI